ncbi:cytochrome c oxidase assembly factor-like [Megalopta genalis]|uniref:cytochrome c oxidase assembly factor-like n=1 Tax=Megalopta genalis TaxID=115081 RepID=UPI0014438406|nr:protein PET117 homolog, mitochondrial [Megalopta genalis]
MSTASKVTFGLCCLTSISIVIYVHNRQEYDRKQLHLGVVRDKELQERRRIQNLYYLQQQNELTKQLKLAESQKKELETV